MSIFERFISQNNNDKIKSTGLADANMPDSKDPIEEAKLELAEEILNLQEQAENVEKKPTPVKIKTFAYNLKDAEARASTACIRKYGYNPPKELLQVYAHTEQYYNLMIKDHIKDSLELQDVMSDLNEIMGSSDLDKIKEITKNYNNKTLERTSSHPGILSKNEKQKINIDFSGSDTIEAIKEKASKFYRMCESSVQRIFIFIQKLFNDLLNIFDTSKASLKNDARGKMVNNQIAR